MTFLRSTAALAGKMLITCRTHHHGDPATRHADV
jgi:hypothetical protein